MTIIPPIDKNPAIGLHGLRSAMNILGRWICALFLAASAICAGADLSFADTRVALVIGNGAYQNAPRLPNPANDAAAVADALKRAGFDTILATDLSKAGMEEATARFARAARSADVAMFYYSGHALQFAGVNYLAPVDIDLKDETDLRRMTRVDDVVADLAKARNLRILVLDSCRDNPLADQLRRSIGASRALPLQRGLAKIDSPEGMIIAYATQAGRTANDGDGRNSPYTAAFLKHIDEKEEIGSIFRRISNDVYETTKHEQLPELSLSLIGEFYLNGKLQITVAPAPEAKAEAPPDVASQLRTRVGMPFNAADAPFMCDKCRDDLGKGIAGKPGHSAVVLSFDGGSFWSFGKTTTAEARKIALAQCLDAGRLDCFVYAIDGQITWAEPSPPLSVKPWFKRDPQTEQPIDFQKLPNIDDKPRLTQLYSRIKGKALAVGPFRQWTITGKADSDEEAARVVLERCAYVTHVPCRVIALGNSLVVPLASLEAWPTAAPAMPGAINAAGPVYAPSGPVVLPGEIPFICDDCRDQVGKALSEQRLHTAVVISLAGGFWIAGGRGTAEEARTVALGDCLAFDSLTCFVYALDGQMVWKDATAPMPAAPWFTHDATIERPLDVAALPGFSASSKQYVRDFYIPVKTPKAIAAGHGTFALAFGLKYPASSENEAARMALERCGYIAQAPCRIIAIGDSSVVKLGAN